VSCDGCIGDQRRDEASAKHDADSVCFVHAAGNGDYLGDAAQLVAGDADHAPAEWWSQDLSATAEQDRAGVGPHTGVEKLSPFMWSDAVVQLRPRGSQEPIGMIARLIRSCQLRASATLAWPRIDWAAAGSSSRSGA
jgi:hypothetical protein